MCEGASGWNEPCAGKVLLVLSLSNLKDCVQLDFSFCNLTNSMCFTLQAKKLIESAPVLLKENVEKEDAEKIKAELLALGAEVVLE